MVERRIVCAALRHTDGAVILGVRHFDRIMLQQIEAQTERDWTGCSEQGFVDNSGTFVDRKEALHIALEAQQMIRRYGGDTVGLFSENIY